MTPPRPLQVAVTIDDVPYQTTRGGGATVSDPSEQRRVNDQMAGHLRAAGVPATVYVNCDNLGDGGPVLDAWHGFDVGNHTAAHGDLHGLEREEWATQVRSCHETLAGLGHTPTTFRYPYLHRGLDADQRDWAARLLTELGERAAPVTAATSEWLLAQHYEQADVARRAFIGQLYVEHMVAALAEADRLARACRGSGVPQVTLLHVNRLNADWLDDVLVALGRQGWDVISLDEALRDPLYAEPDLFAGRGSPSWLGRVDRSCDVSWFGAQEPALSEALDRPPG
jgi:hypothetical protein